MAINIEMNGVGNPPNRNGVRIIISTAKVRTIHPDIFVLLCLTVLRPAIDWHSVRIHGEL